MPLTNLTHPHTPRLVQRCFYKHGQFNEQAAISSLMAEMEEAEAKRLVERKGSPGPASRETA